MKKIIGYMDVDANRMEVSIPSPSKNPPNRLVHVPSSMLRVGIHIDMGIEK